ncbi:extracellular solute-binding protein [Motiliproteus sp. MSK22-1]|uniref:extracellular solute-binding protein n=1 Tax=Motiliproteus sp. MSK22-1 TaxID=1897630 RepID=UPI0011809624|nr:extracellular solute-binding protein [Motiliproteus sp. MSK22-1]
MKKLIEKSGMISALALGLAAADAGATDWNKELKKHDGVKLRIQTIQDPFIDSLKKISPDFEKLTNSSVEIEGFGYDPLHEKQILNCSQRDDQYDVLFIDGIWTGEFVEAGCIDPIEKRVGRTNPEVTEMDDYIESFTGQAYWNGTLQCLPVAGYWHMLHYRKDLFEKANIKVPETFAELKAAAKFFSESPDFPGVDGMAMNFQRGSAAGQQFFEWIYSAGGKPWESNYPGSNAPYKDQTPLFNSPKAVEMVQFFKDMVPYGPPGVEQFAWDERANAFTQGKVAMINNWSVRTPLFTDPKISKVWDKFDVAMFPHAEGEKSVPPVGGWVMCLNAHSKQKKAAWDFMKWFASPEIHKSFVLAGGPPSRHSAMQDRDIIAAQPWVPTLYESSKKAWAESRPRHAMTFEMIDALGLQVNRAIVGDATPQEAMDRANENITKMLTRAGYIDK